MITFTLWLATSQIHPSNEQKHMSLPKCDLNGTPCNALSHTLPNDSNPLQCDVPVLDKWQLIVPVLPLHTIWRWLNFTVNFDFAHFMGNVIISDDDSSLSAGLALVNTAAKLDATPRFDSRLKNEWVGQQGMWERRWTGVCGLIYSRWCGFGGGGGFSGYRVASDWITRENFLRVEIN